MKIFSHTMRAGEMGIQWFPFSRLKGNSVLNIHVLLCRDGRYDPQRREMYARRRQMKRNNKFQKLSLWGALGGLALLGNTIAWSRSTSQPPSLNGKLRRQESQQSAASSSYAVRAIEESVSGTVSGRILYSGKPVQPKRFRSEERRVGKEWRARG